MQADIDLLTYSSKSRTDLLAQVQVGAIARSCNSAPVSSTVLASLSSNDQLGAAGYASPC